VFQILSRGWHHGIMAAELDVTCLDNYGRAL
jgi:hypothetical protein